MTKREKSGVRRLLCLTFDYELSFDISGTPAKSMVEPTTQLLRVARSEGLRFTFFVDATYLLRLDGRAEFRDTRKAIDDQLREVISDGHQIALHLHPSWMDASFDPPYWRFTSYEHYRLQSLSEDEICTLLREGKDLLEGIAHGIEPSYRVRAFRAGGWCLMPFGPLQRGFMEAGIVIDSSIAPGMRISSLGHQVDYTMAKRLSPYRFSKDPLVEDTQGGFVEVPISTRRIGLADRLRRKAVLGRYPARGDGRGIRPYTTLFSRFLPARSIASLDSCYNAHENVHDVSGEIAVYNSHPKLLNDLSFEALMALAEFTTVTIDEAADNAP